jgi:RNA polymerase sigma factor (sigma-70 family)
MTLAFLSGDSWMGVRLVRRGLARDEDAQARILAALRSLPAQFRKVLVLREVEGLGMGEVAARLGLSRHAVEQRWARAIVLMSERLAEMERGRGR